MGDKQLSKLLVTAGGEGGPSNTSECLLWGNRAGCGLVFRVAFGIGCSAFAVVSFSRFVGPRSVLVLVVPRGGGFGFLDVGSRLVQSFAFGSALVVLRVRWFRFVCPLVRRLVLVDSVEIWPKSAKFAS